MLLYSACRSFLFLLHLQPYHRHSFVVMFRYLQVILLILQKKPIILYQNLLYCIELCHSKKLTSFCIEQFGLLSIRIQLVTKRIPPPLFVGFTRREKQTHHKPFFIWNLPFSLISASRTTIKLGCATVQVNRSVFLYIPPFSGTLQEKRTSIGDSAVTSSFQ